MSNLRREALPYVPLLERQLQAPAFVPQAQRNQNEMRNLLREANAARRRNMPNAKTVAEAENNKKEMNSLLKEINQTRSGGKRRAKKTRKHTKKSRRKTRRT